MAIVHIDNVSRHYQDADRVVKALDGLDLTIEPGEFTAVMGPSGSGKTTLLNMIGGLDTPTEGRVLVSDREVSSMSKTQRADMRRDHVGFIFQSYNLVPVLSARENTEFVLELQGVSPKERAQRASEVLAAVGLEGMEDRRPSEMSGGQQQRVAVARAIASKPSIILADEPTANLDSETKQDLIALMRKMNEEEGVTFLFSTHDPEVISVARRVLRMRDGDIEEDERGLFIALEHVNGVDLGGVNATLRSRGEALPFELAALIAAEILRALHHAHEAQTEEAEPLELVHRNVHPDNVLIADTGHIKLTGFGVVRMRQRSQAETQPGVLKGRLTYLPPEAVESPNRGDRRGDIYSVGIMLLELLTGRPCFSRLGAGQISKRIVEGDLPLHRLARENVPKELEKIVTRATEHAPAKRFASAQEMANAIESWLVRSQAQASPWILAAFFEQHELFDADDADDAEPLTQAPSAPSSAPPPLPEQAPESEDAAAVPAPTSARAEPESSPDTNAKPEPAPVAQAEPSAKPDVPPAPEAKPKPSIVAQPEPEPLAPAKDETPESDAAVLPPLPDLPPPPVIDDDEPTADIGPPPDMPEPAAEPTSITMAPARNGAFEDRHPTEVLEELAKEEATGTLTFDHGAVWKKLTLISGRPMEISTNIGMEALEDQLVKRNIITRADVERLQREMNSNAKSLLERLVDKKLVDADRLAMLLGEIISAGLKEVIGWKKGSFSFEPGTIETPAITPALDLVAFASMYTPSSGDAPAAASAAPRAESQKPAARLSLADALKIARNVARNQGTGRVDNVDD